MYVMFFSYHYQFAHNCAPKLVEVLLNAKIRYCVIKMTLNKVKFKSLYKDINCIKITPKVWLLYYINKIMIVLIW